MSTTPEPNDVGWNFDNTYSRLTEGFFAPATPARFRAPRLSILNERYAEELGLKLKALSPQIAGEMFAGQTLPCGAFPIAQAYAGHQFGHFTMLGDGRAILLGEHRTPKGQRVDIQLKGAGPTPYSRRGDGLAALGPMLREHVISEAMAALGIPTTRSLAVVVTGETVYRMLPQRGAVLARVAASHIRVGTFELFAARNDVANLRRLADYTIDRHDPELAGASDKYLRFLRAVMDRQARLLAQWQSVGFIHGVMNTDNMAISGETIDYGPCAFMNEYDPATVFSSIDHGGRYAYGRQPAIAQWNLARLAESLLPLLDSDEQKAIAVATEAVGEFPAIFDRYWRTGMQRKLGLEREEAGDLDLIRSLLDWMLKAKADFTNSFRSLSEGKPLTGPPEHAAEFAGWHSRWQDRLVHEDRPIAEIHAAMQTVNPAVIARNHRVEEALAAAEERDDLAPLNRLLEVLQKPFEVGPYSESYQDPPSDDREYRTFCGT